MDQQVHEIPATEIPPAKRHESIAVTITKYASSRIYGQFFGAFTAFCRPNLLNPAQFGLWTALKIIPTYTMYLHLGTMSSMRFMIPYYSAKGNPERASSAKDTVFTLSLVLNLLAAIAFCVVALQKRFTMEERFGLFCVAGMIVLQFCHDFCVVLLRANEKFSLITSANYLRAIVTFALTIPLLYLMGIYGLYLSALLVNVIIIGYFWKHFDLDLHKRFHWNVFKELFGKGFPMLLAEMSMILITTAGPIIISKWLSAKELGYFGIAMLIVGFLQHLPGTAREILEPRMMRSVADSSTEHIVNEYLLKPFINTAFLLPLVLGPIILMLPAFVPLVLPRYTPGIVPTQILVCGFYFLALSEPSSALVFAFDWQVKSLFFMPAILLVNAAISIFLIGRGYGIAGVALGSSISYFLLFVAYLIFLAVLLKDKGKAWMPHVAATFIPLPVMGGAIFLLHYVVPRIVKNSYLSAILCSAILMGVMFLMHRLACARLPLLKKIPLKTRSWQRA